MQLQVNLLIELDDVPDEVITRLSEHEDKLVLSLGDIMEQLRSRKVSSSVVAQKLLYARQALSDLDRFLQESSRTIQSYGEAILQREAAFVEAQAA